LNNEEKILSMLEVLTTDIKDVKSDVKDVKDRLEKVEDKLDKVEDRLEKVEDRLEKVEYEVVKTNISIENNLWPAVLATKDVLNGQIDKLKDVKKNVENMEPTVTALDIIHMKKRPKKTNRKQL